MWTTCPESLREAKRPGLEPATSWLQVNLLPQVNPGAGLEKIRWRSGSGAGAEREWDRMSGSGAVSGVTKCYV